MVKCLNKHGKIDMIDNQKKVGGSILSQKIIRVLNNAVEQLHSLCSDELRPKTQLIKVQTLIHTNASKLKHERTYELREVKMELIESRESINKENESPYDNNDIQFMLQILDHALNERKEMSRKATHPVERQYVESPIFSVTTPNVKTLKKLVNEAGKLVEYRTGFRTVEYSSAYGYLTSFDFKVFVGLQRIWELKGKSKEFTFNYGELAEVIEANKDGGTYEAIGASITKLGETTIIIHDYKDAELQKKIRTEGHNVIQSYIINHEKKNVSVLFNDYLYKSLISGNYVRINLSIYQDLNSSTSKLLYPLITSLVKEDNLLDLDDIINTLGIKDVTRKKTLSRIKKSFEELREYKIISDFSMLKEGRSIKKIQIVPSEDIMDQIEEGLELGT